MTPQVEGTARLSLTTLAFVWAFPPLLLCAGLFGVVGWSATEKQLLVATLLPTLFGYVVVGVGAGLLKLWRWNVPGSVRGVLPHIGFYYAAYFVAALALVFPALAAGTALQLIASGVAMGATMIVVGTIHDTLLLRSGAATVRSRLTSHWRIVIAYSPIFLGWSGFTYGVTVAAARSWSLSIVVPTAVLLMCGPYLVWFTRLRPRETKRHG